MPRLLASLLVTLFLLLLSLVASAATPARPAASIPAAAIPPAEMARLARENPVPVWNRNGILVEQGGRALYTFANDSTGQSTCDRPCEGLWPPHYAEPGDQPSGPFTIARSFDGRPMWAWRGKPLYRWVSDRKRGAAGGDGVAGVWFLVKVPPALAAQVVPYFPMPMPRAGTIRTVFPTATPTATTTPRTPR
jgi:predicted lipoprotein with Yx(FWY)xxD motif